MSRINDQFACSAVRRDGSPCSAPRVLGSTLCWAHEPALHEKRDDARRTRRKAPTAATQRATRARPADAARMAVLIEEAIEAVRAGTLTASRAQAISALARSWATLAPSVQGQKQLAERLDRIEEMADGKLRSAS